MLNTITTQELYHAETAYQLRPFAKTRRYRVNEITAHTVTKDAPCRKEVETFIAAVFQVTYGATITEFMPILVALRDESGVLMAAFGMRKAREEKLFLEQYLDTPIEQLLTEKLGKPIFRNEITCIGNLAVSNPRNAGVLIAHVIQHSLDIGIQWCVATAHHSLQNGLIKGGRDVYPLHQADKKRLPLEEQAIWGSYYDHTPQVVAIRGVAEY
ncbi:MAG: thermostable hemolysin [Methylophilaceae bacterium]